MNQNYMLKCYSTFSFPLALYPSRCINVFVKSVLSWSSRCTTVLPYIIQTNMNSILVVSCTYTHFTPIKCQNTFSSRIQVSTYETGNVFFPVQDTCIIIIMYDSDLPDNTFNNQCNQGLISPWMFYVLSDLPQLSTTPVPSEMLRIPTAKYPWRDC